MQFEHLLERFDVPEGVVDWVVVVSRYSILFPCLCAPEITLETRIEITDSTCRVTEWIVPKKSVELVVHPLPVIGGIVTHEDGAAIELLEPRCKGRKDTKNFVVREPFARPARSDARFL